MILSGGDPLSLGNDALETLLQGLAFIPHVNKIRFHTRFPIGIPERIDADFLTMLSKLSCQIYFVIHCNHVNELDEDIFASLRALQKINVVLLCQTVLLKEVNDSEEALKDLFEALVDHGVLPYYLHQLDRVEGGAHFEVPEEKGKELMRALYKKLPGYALPRYVREVAGQPHKSILPY